MTTPAYTRALCLRWGALIDCIEHARQAYAALDATDDPTERTASTMEAAGIVRVLAMAACGGYRVPGYAQAFEVIQAAIRTAATAAQAATVVLERFAPPAAGPP